MYHKSICAVTYLEYSVYFNMQKFFWINHPFAAIFLIITLARVFWCFAVWNCIRIRVILIRAVAFRLGCSFLCRWLLRLGSGWHLFYWLMDSDYSSWSIWLHKAEKTWLYWLRFNVLGHYLAQHRDKSSLTRLDNNIKIQGQHWCTVQNINCLIKIQ